MTSLQIIRSSAQITIDSLRRSFKVIFIAQIPLAVSEITQECLGVNDAVQPSAAAIMIVLPLYFVMSFFSSALTFATMKRSLDHQSPTFAAVWSDVRQRFGALFIASLVVGLLSGMGFVALVLPGLFLLTYFLFVPHLILADDPTSLWAIVTRSKKLAFGHFPLSFCLVLVSFGLSAVLYLLGEHYGTYLGAVVADEAGRRLLLLGIRVTLAMAGGGLIDVIIAAYFLTLRRSV